MVVTILRVNFSESEAYSFEIISVNQQQTLFFFRVGSG
jgi:hypothetical protein